MNMPAKRIPMAVCAAMTALLVGCASPASQDRRGATERGERAQITEIRVRTALSEALGVAAAAIDVDAKEGVVTLSGFTADRSERDRAIGAARGIDGVQRVVDRIEVKQ